jgi:type II secretion system protein D
VISSPEAEWPGIRAMLEKLDSEEYDSTLQLRVFPLKHAGATSVAAAINTAFKGDAQERQQAAQIGPDGRPIRAVPGYLVKNENWVSAVAEAQTNSVIVSANRQNLRKIESIVQELDGEQSAKLPAARLIPVKQGASATMLANALKTVFAPEGGPAASTARAPRIIPDETAGVVIVRAEDGDWNQIRELAETLQVMSPEPGSSLFMIELQHLSAEAAAQVVNGLGMNGQGPPDARGRVVKGNVRVAPVPGRNALAVAALPEDRTIVADLIKSVDIEPKFAQSEGQLVRLKVASATAVAASVQKMLDTAAAPGSQGLAKALQEQVRRLRIHRDGVLTADLTLDLTKPIRLAADEKTNSIMVTGAQENVDAARELIGMLDDVPLTESVTLRIMPMENIPAADFARVVKDLFAQGKALGKLPGAEMQGVPEGDVGHALLDSVAITVIDRTNTVVVAGREESVALVEAMQLKLDNAKQTGWVEPRIIKLRYAAASDLAQTLDAVLVQGQTNLPDAGPMQKQVARLRTVQQLENGAPGQVIESDVFTPMSRTLIRADETLNALIVVSTENNLATVEQLVRMLDVEAASPAASVRTYPLARAGAGSTAQRLTAFFEQQASAKAIRPEDKVRILPDERTNSIVVSTSAKSFAVVEELLKQLDREIPADLRELKTIQLTNASSNRLAPLIQQLMDARLDRLRAVEPRAADLQKITVLSDERANMLLISGGADAFDVVKGIVAQLDTVESGEVAPLHVVPMQRGNLDRVAAAVNQIMDRRYADLPATVAKRARPLVMTDPRSNCLLIAATEADFKDIQGLVAKIEEQPTDPAVGIFVVPVQGVRVETIATQLQAIMRDRSQSLGETARPSDRVSIGSDLATNTLIVASSPENLEIVKGLIDSLKAAGADSVSGREFQIVQLKKSRATDLVAMLDNMYIREENRRRGADSVRAIADPRINAVVLSGASADITSLRSLIGELEEAKPTQVVEIKYIPLQYANTLEITGLIDSVLSGNNLAGRGQQQATVVRYLKQVAGVPDESTEMEVNAAVRQAISLTPDVRSNTVIVRAPKDSMDLIERMVKDLDRDDASAQNVRVIKMQHAEAESIAEILTDLFRLNRRGNLYVLKPRDSVLGAEGADGPTAPGAIGVPGTSPDSAGRSTTIAGLELNMVPDEKQELSITVDPRSNSLLISGTPNYLNAVERVVKELDTDQLGSREQQVYKLKNAGAADVAATLTKFVDGERAKMVEAYGANRTGVSSRLLDQAVTVVGDVKSNSVLLTGSQRYMERLKGIIRELDVEPPQVLIQVMLAEVTLDNTEDLGLEFVSARFGNGYSVNGGFGLDKGAFGASQPKPPGLLALAPALFAGLGIPNIAIGGPDFDLLLNALASQSRVQLLSNPSIMVSNNTVGRIQVGQTIRVPDAVTVSSAGQQSAVTPEEVGIILEVTPSINMDGFVKMEVEPEISILSKQTIDISETFRSPIIDRRRANTTITVRDGETVVIGGLINDRFERIDKKIPLLGDIPLLGLLFRQKSESSVKTELLIVLRPHVVRTPAHLKELTEEEVKRLTLQPGLKEQILNAQLKGMQGRFNEKGELIDPLGAPSETPDVDGDEPMKEMPKEEAPPTGTPPSGTGAKP